MGQTPYFMTLWMSRIDKVFETGKVLRVQDEQEMMGRLYYTDSIISPIYALNEAVSSVCVVYRDVTELKKTEIALSQEKERLLVTLRSIGDGVITTDTKGRITLINKIAEKLTGWTQVEAYERDIKDVFNIINVKTGQQCENTVEKVLKAKSVVEPSNYTNLIARDGTERMIANSGAPIFNINSEIIGVVLVFRDVTEKNKIETQLQQAQKMESIGTLAGGIAHDFNNILFPIVGHTEMLIEDFLEDSPYRDSLNEIYTAGLRARELVQQILAFSRQQKNEIKRIKIQPIFREALKMIRSTISTTIDINQNIDTECSAINADPIQIHQIIMNLAINAFHAMEDDGGTLTASLKEVELGEPDLINPDMKPGNYAHLVVADTGIGIDKDVKEKIFDPFFTTKKEGKGTGMGLSVVHGIVTSMGGAIQVYSKLGKGTQFNLYFPVEKNVSEDQKSQAEEPFRRGTEQILLVDDEESIIKMEKRMLERWGYHITPHTSSIEALETFRSTPDKFDLVITDMAMPAMPGNKLSAELIKIRPDIPILLCTGYSEKFSEEKVLSVGIKGFLFKPIMMKDLSKKMRDVLVK
ncbi:two component system sensor histidine kinase, hybrid [Desulfobacula toluolica Tol2]|uniref:histidine kinase n=1 Tax=Desulfobacula toluolica (strain DSM 7467 / Tol2) TaxID=651182 RepID=K0NIK6_DESTT|nr:two component system sensor histidine kinase, hybrid [Desulfobacula toluolica Tol2]